MKLLLPALIAAVLTGCFATVGRDGRTTFSLFLPADPPLVVVEPGVSVVRDYEHEVFYVDGYYWARQDRVWYRARDHRSTWVFVEERQVPGRIVRYPPGQYRRYRGHERQEERRSEERGQQGEHGRGDDHRR